MTPRPEVLRILQALPGGIPSPEARTREAEDLHRRQKIAKPAGAVEPPVCKCEGETLTLPPEDDMPLRCAICSKRLA